MQGFSTILKCAVQKNHCAILVPIMDTGIDILAVVVADSFGIMLLFMVVFSNRWRLSEKSLESGIVLAMVTLSFVSCVLNMLSCVLMGQPGFINLFCIYFGTWWLFFAHTFLGPLWIFFVCVHLNTQLPRWIVGVIIAAIAVCLVPLVINFFYPLVFSIDDDNIYHRGPLYLLYVLIQGGFLLGSIVIYYRAKGKGSMLKVFPIWLFVVPIAVGMTAQSMKYGISTIWPCVAIAVAGVASALQNSFIYQDQLTKLYSRAYLDYLKRQIDSSKSSRFTAIMLDLNGFKSINDTYGHSEGDAALVKTGELLNGVVRFLGVVVRYAGDEFVVLLNTQDDAVVEEVRQKVKQAFDEYNLTSGKGYKLLPAMGISKFDLSVRSVDELMNEIDRRMFEDKRLFYEINPQYNRRGASR